MQLKLTAIVPTSDRPLVDFAELWQYRQLFYVLVWRTIKVRYQQTVVGVGWALLQPLLLTFVMTFIFGLLVQVPTNGKPYPIFVLSGLIVWQFVANALNQASISIVANAHIVTRIYFPRMLMPLAAAFAAMFDFLCASMLLLAALAWYGFVPTIGVIAFIPMFAMATIVVIGLSLWFSALNVRFRDVAQLLPFLVQLWMFLSPVIYPTTLLPKEAAVLYALNPIAVVIDTARWGFLDDSPPSLVSVAVSLAVALTLLLGGLWFFRRHEGAFADIV